MVEVEDGDTRQHAPAFSSGQTCLNLELALARVFKNSCR